MPKSRPPYTPVLRRRMVELVRSGRSPESLAQEYEPSGQAIRNWVRQAERDEGKRVDGAGDRKDSVRIFEFMKAHQAQHRESSARPDGVS